MPRASKPNKDEIESKVRERAYALWEADGRLPGLDLDYWFRAEAELNPPEKPHARKKTGTTNGARSSRAAKPARTKRTPAASTPPKKRPS